MDAVDRPRAPETAFLRLRQTAALCRATFLESLQQPATLLLTLTCVVLIALVPVFQFHTLSEEGRLARDSGLAFMLVFGLVLAATAASATVAGEIASGTAAVALSKPLPRPLFLLGKFSGVLALLALFWIAALAATLLAERASEHFVADAEEGGSQADNITSALALLAPVAALAWAGFLSFRRRARFAVAAGMGIPASLVLVTLLCGCYTRFGHWTWYHPDLNPRVPAAGLLVLLALVLFAALATALATRLAAGPTLALCALALALGLAGDLLIGGAPAWSARGWLAALAPNISSFWLCDALADGGSIPARYLASAAAYACAWCALALGCGMLAFRRRDLG